jgi:ribose transport system substrate-binding protein
MTAAGLLLAACGGGGSGSGESAAGSGSGAAADVAAYQKVVDDATAPVTTWNGPTSAPAPTSGKRVAVITCAAVVSGCARQAEGVQQAGALLGWTVTVFDGKGDPVEWNRAATQAVNSGVDAIVLAAADPVPMKASLDLAAQRGIPVGTTGVGIAAGNGVAFDVGADYGYWGRVLGNWIVADSRGSANLLQTTDKEFPSQNDIVDEMNKVIGTCSGCTIASTEQFVVTDIGNGLGQRIANTLQRLPQVTYLNGAYDSAAADMISAIRNAGLGSRVKVVSCVGAPQNLGFVADGELQKVDIVQDDIYLGFAAVDQMNRLLSGQPLWTTPGETNDKLGYSQGAPSKLLTPANVGDPNQPWVAENDYVAQYRKLWGV